MIHQLKHSRSYIEAALATIIWGASFVATKIALRELSPVAIVWVRFLIGFIVLGGFTFARKEFSLPARKELPMFALLALLGLAMNQWLQSTGLKTAQASTTGWIISTSSITIALLSWIFLKERLSPIGMVGFIAASVGVLLVVSNGDLGGAFSGLFSHSGNLLVLVSSFSWASFSVISRGAMNGQAPTRMMFYIMFFGVLYFSVSFFSFDGLSSFSGLSLQTVWAILFLGVICSGLAYVFYFDALDQLPASKVGVFLYFEPVVSMTLGALLLSEPLLWTSLLGGVLIICGVWVVNRSKTPAAP